VRWGPLPFCCPTPAAGAGTAPWPHCRPRPGPVLETYRASWARRHLSARSLRPRAYPPPAHESPGAITGAGNIRGHRGGQVAPPISAQLYHGATEHVKPRKKPATARGPRVRGGQTTATAVG